MAATRSDRQPRGPGAPAKALALRAAAILTALTALAACTPTVWYNPAVGFAPEEVTEACRDAAARAAYSWGLAGWPGFGLRPYGWPLYDPWYPFGYNDSSFLEQDLFDYCMRVRGYRLVPARPADQTAHAPTGEP